MNKQISFGVSVPTLWHKEMLSAIAARNNRPVSRQITHWIEQSAVEMGLTTDYQLKSESLTKQQKPASANS